MSDNVNAGCAMTFLVILTIAASIGSGVLAWNWVEPESFGGAILFLLAWGFLSYIGHMIAMGIAALFFDRN